MILRSYPRPAALARVACLAITLWAAAIAAAVDPATLAALRAELEASSDVAEALKSTLEEQLAGAGRDLAAGEEERNRQRDLRATLEQGDARIAEYRARLRDIENAPQSVQRRLGSNPGLEDIEAEIAVVGAQRESWAENRAQTLDAMAAVAAGNAGIQDQLAAVNDRLAELAVALEPAAADSLEDRIAAAAAAAEAEMLGARKTRLQLRLRAEPTLDEIRAAEISWLDAAIADADALLAALQASAAQQRQSAAAQRAAETRRLLASLSDIRPSIARLAADNRALVNDQQRLAAGIEDTRRSLAATRDDREQIEEDANLTRRRLAVAGLQGSLGEVMLSRLASLPDPRDIDERRSLRNARIAALSSSAIDSEQALRERSDRRAYLDQILGGEEDWTAQEQRVAEQLYDQQRELLQENLQAQNTLLRLLVDRNQAADELLQTVRDYEDLLTGNLLWIRNYAFADPQRLLAQVSALRTALAPELLAGSLPAVVSDPPAALLLLLLLLLLARLRRLRSALHELVDRPITPARQSARELLVAVLLTAVIALPVPLLLVLLARMLAVANESITAPVSTGPALYSAALALFILNFARALGGRRGMGQRLLRWHRAQSDALFRDLRWLTPPLVIGVGCLQLGQSLAPASSGGPLAALASFTVAATLLWAAIRILRTGSFAGDRLAMLTLRLSSLLGAAIVVMHLSGQLFAAHTYLWALGASLVAILGTRLIASIAQRLLIIYRFRLQTRARERVDTQAEATEQQGPGMREEPDSGLEMASLSDAHRQLILLLRLLALGSLLWLIWSPALPALSIFDDVTLWTTADSALPEGQLRAVTLTTLLLAMLVIGVTALLTRHLPPLLNALLLEWGHVTAGGRYATGMLMQYFIIGVGGSVTLSLLGFEWSKVQWLVAALGVGIGFGLQEIVANFISGLIVLFERPIRVGDIINAGGNEGFVTRINPRATVVETFDGKEVMIPNKELITNVVTNWSLSSPKLRIVVPVGVAYGSDIVKAMQILLETARNEPEVEEDPAPVVTFEDFGDNALLLWLRCYVTHSFPVIMSKLRVAIYTAYEEAGISIAFPQRDVHLDASAPIPVRMVKDGDAHPA